MSARLHTLRASARRDDGSLLLAILIAVVVTSLIAAAAITTIAGQRKSQATQKFTQGQQAADAAVADALRFFNQGGVVDNYPQDGVIDTYKTLATARQGTVTTGEAVKWSWYVTADPNVPPGDEYDVHITTRPVTGTATSAAQERTFVVHLASLRVAPGSAKYTGGAITYDQAEGPAVAGFFADREAILRGSSKIDSYNANAGSALTGNGMVGSNGIITFDSTATADYVSLWNFTAAPNTDRCSGLRCGNGPLVNQPVRLGVSGTCPSASPYPASTCKEPTKFIDDACATQAVKPWIASENGTTPTLNAGAPICVSSLTFDRNTVVNASPGNPVKIYVTGGRGAAASGSAGSDGAVTVLPGINVNATSAAPQSAALLIYAKADRVTLAAGGVADTKVAWGLWAPNALCAGTTAGARTVHVYGAMTCSRLSTGPSWALHFDDVQRLRDLDAAATGRAWYLTDYHSE